MTSRLLPALGLVLAVGLAACGGTDEPTADLPVDPGAPVSGACLEGDEDCADDPSDPENEPAGEPGDELGADDAASGGAAGACLRGDEDCTDESYGGQDVTNVVPLTDQLPQAEEIARGTSSGATARPITAATVDGTTLRMVVEGGACDVLEDVMVDGSPEEVRVMVLTGQDVDVEMCTQQIVSWTVEAELDEPLGERTLLDLAG